MSTYLRARSAALSLSEALTWVNPVSRKMLLSRAEQRLLSAVNADPELVAHVKRENEDANLTEEDRKKASLLRHLTYLIPRSIVCCSCTWANKTRAVNAIIRLLDTGDVNLDDERDVECIRFVLSSDLHDLPQIIEFYTQTGEFMEFVESFRKSDEKFFHKFSVDNPDAMARARRFYTHDVTKIQELMKSGGDVNEHMGFPFELRMVFAGFWDEVGDDEKNAPLDLDHRELLSESIFESAYEQVRS